MYVYVGDGYVAYESAGIRFFLSIQDLAQPAGQPASLPIQLPSCWVFMETQEELTFLGDADKLDWTALRKLIIKNLEEELLGPYYRGQTSTGSDVHGDILMMSEYQDICVACFERKEGRGVSFSFSCTIP